MWCCVWDSMTLYRYGCLRVSPKNLLVQRLFSLSLYLTAVASSEARKINRPPPDFIVEPMLWPLPHLLINTIFQFVYILNVWRGEREIVVLFECATPPALNFWSYINISAYLTRTYKIFMLSAILCMSVCSTWMHFWMRHHFTFLR